MPGISTSTTRYTASARATRRSPSTSRTTAAISIFGSTPRAWRASSSSITPSLPRTSCSSGRRRPGAPSSPFRHPACCTGAAAGSWSIPAFIRTWSCSGTICRPCMPSRCSGSALWAALTCSSTTPASRRCATPRIGPPWASSVRTASTSTRPTSGCSTKRSKTGPRAWRSAPIPAAAITGPPGSPPAGTISSPRRCSTSSTRTGSSWNTTMSAPAGSSRCAFCPRARKWFWAW